MGQVVAIFAAGNSSGTDAGNRSGRAKRPVTAASNGHREVSRGSKSSGESHEAPSGCRVAGPPVSAGGKRRTMKLFRAA